MPFGDFLFDPYGGQGAGGSSGGGYPSIDYGDAPWYAATINRGLDVVGSAWSRSPYYSPDDPRYREQQQRISQQYPGAYQVAPVGTGGGINLSNTTLMLVVGGVLLFMLGRRR